jgi:hypothetical protein
MAGPVGQLLADEGYETCILDCVPEDLAPPALVLVEADRGSRTVALARQVRSHWPQIAIAGVLPWWADDERDLARLVDLVVHAPLRDDQLRAFRLLAAAARTERIAARTIASLV